MRSVSVRLSDLDKITIPIGFVGENLYTSVIIDCKEVFDKHPSAVPALSVTPPVGDSYPAVTTRDGNYVTWVICDSDLVYKGRGEIQLTFVDDEIIGKTYVANTRILRSIEPTSTAPTPIANWLVAANAALNAIPQDIEDALDEALSAIVGEGETLSPGSSVTVSFDAETKTLHIGVPKGDKGDTGSPGADGADGTDGYSPVATVSKNGKTVTISITDKNGTTTATVSDGEDGSPGQDGQDGQDGADGFSPIATVSKSGSVATISITDKNGTTTAQVSDGDPTTIIDDNSGAGDTDKTWSADKLVSDLKNQIQQKQDAPETAGTAGQVLSLDSNLDPVWSTPQAGSDDDKAPVILATASGSVASFADGADDMPMAHCVVSIDAVQSGSGDPTPQNVRPISGWTGCTVSVAPANDPDDPDKEMYSVTWSDEAGTVYGGTLDVSTGVLTRTHNLVDLTNMTWNRDGNTRLFRSRTGANTYVNTPWNKIVSNCLKPVNGSTSIGDRPDYSISIRSQNYYPFEVVMPSGTTIDQFEAFIANIDGNNTHATALLTRDNPQTYQLTPTEVMTLLGQNYVWADTGDVAVTYPADTKKYVDQNGVTDVQINGSTILTDGVANIPKAGNGTLGVGSTAGGEYGVNIRSDGAFHVVGASNTLVKAGANTYRPITPSVQDTSVFYGLAKASGDTSQSSSANAVGTYTESAKSAIASMLNAPETVSGSTPTINAKAGVRYICGEVSTLTIVVPASGIIDVQFDSGSTPTVLTVTPPTGMTMRWIGDDPTALEANKHYEINIADGCNGMVVSWT